LEFAPEARLSSKDLRRMDRVIQFGMISGMEAFGDSGLDLSDEERELSGVLIGAGLGGIETIENTTRAMAGGQKKVSPFYIPSSIINMISGDLSIELGLRGPNLAITTACSTGTHCIGIAARLIATGDATVMIAGGAEASITPSTVAGFTAARALSRQNEDPQRASRPFDKDRDGFVLGDGAGVLVIEEYEHAKARGAKIYAEVAGFGMSGDAFHMTSPSKNGEGASRCMNNAINDAGLNNDQIQYINAHGTSTPAGDIAETQAIKSSFGADAKKKVIVSSTKSMTGHLLGAAGGIEAIFSILAIKDQVIPPTINIFNQDPECDLDYCAEGAREMKIDASMSNSFGFGGTNGTVIFRKI